MSCSAQTPPEYLETKDGLAIAWLNDGAEPVPAGRCGTFWLGGFKSDMRGSKAEVLANHARATDRSFVRFDYSGHGESGGEFADGTISSWLDQAQAVFTQCASGRRVLIGSSMGGWIALLLARRLVEAGHAARLGGLILIAPAADMTKDLMWDKYGDGFRDEVMRLGKYERPSEYSDEPYVITRALIEDGEQHLVLENGLNMPCPVRILQGEDDPDVPWQHALKTYQALSGDDVMFDLIKHGDHRLSSERNLALLAETAEALCTRADEDA
ncbi:MAG: alpha/beta hydrolase [Pseudomonadota bacterium]